MGIIKSGKVVIVLSGRYAGRKGVVVKTFDEGGSDRKFSHAIVAGIERYPRKVTRAMTKHVPAAVLTPLREPCCASCTAPRSASQPPRPPSSTHPLPGRPTPVVLPFVTCNFVTYNLLPPALCPAVPRLWW